MRQSLWMGLMLLALGPWGCAGSNGLKKEAVQTALNDPGRRKVIFSTTFDVLDEHPEYVEDVFNQILQHPATLNRFIDRAAQQLHSPEFSKQTAQIVMQHPEGLYEVTRQTVEQVQQNPAAVQAMDNAVNDKAWAAIAVATHDPKVQRELTAELLRQVQKDPKAREALLASMVEHRQQLTVLLLNNPKIMRQMLEAMLQSGEKKVGADLRALLDELTGEKKKH